jgi:TrmH family RNA methyltransferase
VLHHPSDCGNVGTILRTALGFGVEDVALIRPCVDVFDPRVVRASMGSLFQLRLRVYDDFADYQAEHPDRMLYPFMLDGSSSLPDVLAGEVSAKWTLVFGNEGSGLPAEFARMGQPVRIPSNDRVDSLNLSIAAAIGIYGFTQKGNK